MEGVNSLTAKTHNMLAVLFLILASILGVFAQNIAYFLNEQNSAIQVITMISISTFLSLVLYMLIPVLYFIWRKMNVYLLYVSIAIAFLVSQWSLLVWMFWMGEVGS